MFVGISMNICIVYRRSKGAVMDFALFKMINGMAGSNIVLDALMIALSKGGPYVFVLVLGGLYWLGYTHKNQKMRANIFSTGVLLILSFIVSMVIGLVYYEPRPFVTYAKEVHLIVAHAADASFPSDHSVGAMAITMGILRFRNRLGLGLMVLAFLVGYSRVFVGNHYPGDVLGAFIMVWIVTYFYNMYLRKPMIALYESVEPKFLQK